MSILKKVRDSLKIRSKFTPNSLEKVDPDIDIVGITQTHSANALTSKTLTLTASTTWNQTGTKSSEETFQKPCHGDPSAS